MKNKKKLAVIISTVILAAVIIATGTLAYAYDVAKKNSIGIDKALNIAMIDAGAREENTTITKAKMEFERSIFVYDIEFVVNNVDEYDYTIKASDGTILDSDHELDKKGKENITLPSNATEILSSTTVQTTQAQATQQKETTQNTTAKSEKRTKKATGNLGENISLEEAKSIALDNAGVSKKNAVFISAHKDYDDGIAYYEIEFKTSSYKYEYEIDFDGNIISFDKDSIKPKQNKTSAKVSASAKYIGVDSAKKIALDNSGLSSGDVIFTKAKLERDDGIYIYEIEFETSTTEYEYEINAITGNIIDKSSEPIDD
ncbi:MAG: PepSY domain-containing protein [Acetobacter sp.]|nr:PepSY domain-containing protein [Bacteroides sp.]MCM1341308.1 PepSY domain-containing protein [Acetobacter sp.]MCM1433916.1 PepSY domain-containing protein [Clostridiales bacterium]